jgi:nucleoside-diphosphate-sugar epimerase
MRMVRGSHRRVVLVGAGGTLGPRVAQRLAEAADVDVLAVDGDALAAERAGATPPSPDAPGELKRLVDEADALVLLGGSDDALVDGTGTSGVQLSVARDVLAACSDSGVRHLVVLSSAMVYGAWDDNPVPLTEDDLLRPNAELAFAVQKAELERLALEWRDEHPGATVAVLRPALAVTDAGEGWLGASSFSPRAVRAQGEPPPLQLVHLDDLADAVVLAVTVQLDGAFNVAPEGWLPPERCRELAGPAPTLRLPARVAQPIEALRHRLGVNPTPPEALAYTRHPWVVSSDRLRAAGWQPSWSNEEAFVVGHPASPLDGLSPKRKQELSLVLSTLLLAGVGAGVWRLLRGRRTDRAVSPPRRQWDAARAKASQALRSAQADRSTPRRS